MRLLHERHDHDREKFLDQNPRPTEGKSKALAANFCRCGTHNRIVRAVLRAAQANGRT